MRDTTDGRTTRTTGVRRVAAIGAIGIAVIGTGCDGDTDADPSDTATFATAPDTEAPPETTPPTEPPATEPPATDPPPTDPPATEPPTTEPAATDPPTTEPPGTDAAPPTVVIGQDENGDDIVWVLEVTKVCGTTFHTPLDDDSLSFIRWEYDAPGLEPGTAVDIIGVDEFRQFTSVLDDRTVVVEQGISSYGDYPYPSISWVEDDDVTSTIDPDGSYTVNEDEGEPSLACLE